MNHVANIAEAVQIFRGGDEGLHLHLVGGEQIPPPAWMHAQCQDHWRRLRAAIGKLVACADFYRHLVQSLAETFAQGSQNRDIGQLSPSILVATLMPR